MNYFYTFLLSFFIIFLSELGDKTQIMVLSFSSKNKLTHILLGISLGTFLSHGFAIVFGSQLASINNATFTYLLNIFTYISFILFGIMGFIFSNISFAKQEHKNRINFISKLSKLKINCIFTIAFCLFIGELGDKTFLSSIGLGIQYPACKLPLIIGSIFGMLASNLIAIILGKLLSFKFNNNIIETISNILFILFGIIGLILR